MTKLWSQIDTHAGGEGPKFLLEDEKNEWIANHTQFRLTRVFHESVGKYAPRWCLDVIKLDDGEAYRITLSSHSAAGKVDRRREDAFKPLSIATKEEIEDVETLILVRWNLEDDTIYTGKGRPYDRVHGVSEAIELFGPAVRLSPVVSVPPEGPSLEDDRAARSALHQEMLGIEADKSPVDREEQIILLTAIMKELDKTTAQIEAAKIVGARMSDEELLDFVARGQKKLDEQRAADLLFGNPKDEAF